MKFNLILLFLLCNVITSSKIRNRYRTSNLISSANSRFPSLKEICEKRKELNLKLNTALDEENWSNKALLAWGFVNGVSGDLVEQMFGCLKNVFIENQKYEQNKKKENTLNKSKGEGSQITDEVISGDWLDRLEKVVDKFEKVLNLPNLIKDKAIATVSKVFSPKLATKSKEYVSKIYNGFGIPEKFSSIMQNMTKKGKETIINFNKMSKGLIKEIKSSQKYLNLQFEKAMEKITPKKAKKDEATEKRIQDCLDNPKKVACKTLDLKLKIKIKVKGINCKLEAML